MKTAQIIDQARARSNIPSDYAIAKTLSVTRQMVSGWRAGDKYPGTRSLFQLAELAGRNPAEVIAEIELERETRAGHFDQAEGWRGVLQRLATAAVSACVVSFVSAPGPASSAMTNAQSAHAVSVYYVNKRRRRSWLDALAPEPFKHAHQAAENTHWGR